MTKLESILPAALGRLAAAQQDRLPPEQAQRVVDTLRQAAPGLHVNLIWNQRPYDHAIAYTLLLRDPQQGTVSISYAPNGNVPWPLRAAQPWRERDLLRVNGVTLSVEEACSMIDVLWSESRLQLTLIDACLIEEQLRSAPPSISDDDIEEAMDAFRRTHGLLEEEQTVHWLRDRGLTLDDLERIAKRAASIRALRRAVAEDRIEVFEQWLAERRRGAVIEWNWGDAK
jgi:putative peptide maturation system protein